ncbi:hypothetical protein Moror_4250 [Moniliophthora roreri MCA 2997]|uniref:F-box domain-containing protein n=2 Tax=Moniliophthora roreri TaxID=221103 RepID=V2XCM1_MONRO|nr:hypothetical protein Moror_4250 [Moniliophthora roreri MCA 2997]
MMPESPFLHRFGTNYAPSPKEVEGIKQILLEPEKTLRVLEEEIARLQAERDELQSFVDNHRSLLSPVRRTPIDILREVFVRCLPDDRLPVRTLREAPLLLTGICRTWREIAISTPHLWNRIHISLPEPPSFPIKDFFRELVKARQEGLESWLSRSGSLPLTFSFHAGLQRWIHHSERPESWDELKTLYLDFTRHLLSYSSRWGNVSLNVPHFIRNFLQTYEVGQLNALQELRSTDLGDICARVPSATTVPMHPLDTILSRAPLLHVLHLKELYVTRLSVRWENITDLVLSSCYESEVAVSEVVRLLSNCTSLRQCTVHNIQFKVNHQITLGNLTAVLPYLHTLNLQFNPRIHGYWFPATVITTPQPIGAVFDAISAPRLTHLSISLTRSVPSLLFDTTPLISFVERFGCVLSSLQLHLPVASDGLIGLLRSMPQLSNLTLHCVLGQTPTIVGFIDLLRALTPGLANIDALCPLLEEVTFGDCAPEDVVLLLAFAEARCGSSYDKEVVKLKRMLVTVTTFLEEAEVISSRLQGLRDRGMSILWCSSRPPEELYDDSPLCGITRTQLEPALSWERMLSSDAYLY